MKKSKKLLSILLAITMIFGTISVGVSAAYAPYLDDALTNPDHYNSVDQVNLTTAQQASLLLDKVDRALEDAALSIDIPLIGTLNLTSVDNALASIYSLTGNWLYGSATVGDLEVLETYRADIASVRRTTDDKTDTDVLDSVVTYIGHCAPTLAKIVDNSFDWKIVKGFLPANIRILINDIPGFIKETLWDLVHPTTNDPYSKQTLDDIVQYVLDNQVGGKNAAALGFEGILPGFDLDLATANGYRTIEEVAFAAMNTLLVPLLNSGLKGVIQNAIVTNAQKGGSLEDLINPDYVITTYAYDRSKSLTEQLNAILGHVVDEMLKSGQKLFTWYAEGTEGAAGKTGAALVEDNITRLIKVIIPLGGDTSYTEAELNNMSTEELGQYIARSAVEEFVKHVEIPEGATMRQIAVIGMKEFIASIVPDATYSVTNTDSNEAILECAKVIGVFYFNNLFDFNCPTNVDFDTFLDKLLTWALPYINGIVDTSDFAADDTVWQKLDKIVWDVVDKEWFNYEDMFNNGAGTASSLTVNSLVNYVMDTFLDLDFDQLFTFFKHSPKSSLNTKDARQVIIDLVTRLINGVVPGTITTTITNLEDVMNTATLKTALSTLLQGIAAKKDTLLPTALNLIVSLMGAANEQSLGEAGMAIAERVNCSGGTVPSGTKIRVSNLSSGVNRGYHDAAGTLHQDAMYQIELVSLTSSEASVTPGAVAGQVIGANGFLDVAVSGSVDANKEVRFDLAYKTILETKANGTKVYLSETPTVTSIYSHFFKDSGNYEATTAESGQVHKSKVHAFPAYLYATSIDSLAIFSTTLEHNYQFLGGDNDGQIIVQSKIQAKDGSAIPAYTTANVPESGRVFTLDGVSMTVQSSYGTANPYLVNRGVDDPEPYGIYEMQLCYDIKGGASGETVTTNWQDHTVVIYNDYGLPGLLDSINGANRQRGDFAADATAEWNAYQAIMLQAYALANGNPDHAKMFDAVGAYGNAYDKMAADVNAAVAALDAKSNTTSADAVAALKAVLVEQESPANFDYVNYELYSFRRWQSWQQSAWSMVSNQESATPSFIRTSDLKYAQYMLELLYPRMIAKAANKTALNAAITAYGAETEPGKAPDTWADYAAAKADALAVQADTSAVQAKVNAARVNLMKAHRNLKDQWIVPTADSNLIVDSRQMFIYGLEEGVADLVADEMATTVAGATLAYEMQGDALGTGSYIKVMSGGAQVALYTVVLFGDLNGDGVSGDAADIAVMDAYIAGTSTIGFFAGGPFFTAADLNGDGVIDAADRAILAAGTYDQQGPSAS